MKPTLTLTTCKRRLLILATALAITGLRAVSAADYPTTVLADNPLAFWRLDETSGNYTAADSSASGLYSANYNYSSDGAYPVLGQPGIDTNSISLSGFDTPDYVDLPYTDALNQPGPFSFEIWIRPTSIPTDGNYRCPIGDSAAYDTATQSGWYVYQTPDSPSELALVTPTGDVFITTTNYTTFKWYYLAGTYDGTNMSFYLNGVLVGTQKASAYVANSVNNAGVCTFSLGQRGDGYGNFDGGLDDAAFYTNALSGAQIFTHYTVGTNSFRIAALPPTILSQPAPVSVYAGQTATFSVQADGATPLYYQWYNGASVVPGATSPTYDFVTTPAEDGNSYSVVVSNYVGSVTSSVASLTVSTGLQIDAPLTSVTRTVGSAAAFEVVAEGAEPITYQWYNGDSTIIPGATNRILWIYNVQLTNDADSYYVEVINPYTSIPSVPATLSVQARAVNVPTNAYADVILADGPIAYWHLDETSGTTNAIDAVGSFNGNYVAGPGSFAYDAAPGVPHDTNPALGIASGATIQVPYALEINPPGAFTVEGWFNASSVAGGGNDYRVPISSMSNPYGEGPTGWLVYQTAGNNWSWWPYNGYYGGVQLTDYAQIVPNQWYYLTLVYDGTTFTFYVNGVAQASGTDSAFVQNGNVPVGGAANYNYNYNTTPGLPTGSGNMVFGQRVDDAFNPFSGTIGDIAVYAAALTPQQIQNHFLGTTHLTIAGSGKTFVVSWSAGTLQSSTNAAGPYLNVGGATSPYTNSISGKQVFFRAQLQ